MRYCYAVLFLSLISLLHAQNGKLEQDVARYQQLIQQQEAELATIDDVIGDVRRELSKEIAERDRLSEEVLRLRGERDAIRATIDTLREQQLSNETKRQAIMLDLDVLKKRLQELLVSLHKGRSTPYVRLLTESKSLFDLRLNAHYLNRLTNQEVTLLQTFEQSERDLAAVNAELEQQVRESNRQVAALEQKAAELNTAQAALDAKIAELEADQAGRLAAREAALQEQQRYDSLLQQAQRNLAAERERQRQARIEAERRAADARRAAEQARREKAAQEARARATSAENDAKEAEVIIQQISVPATAPQSGFQSPFHNASVRVPYGDEGAFVLLQAERPYDAVRSVMSGVVLTASRISANSGYVVMIQHSEDLVSAYGNLQEPLVTVNEQVGQGQVLGYVGGGTFNPADILDFRIGVPQSSGAVAWVDPSARLGLQ